MSNQMEQQTAQKLHAFARRRRRLVLFRGVLAATAALLVTMLAVAAVDSEWLLPDWLRWTLSGLAYAAVLWVAWRQCLRQLVNAPDERQIARMVECAEPGLREDLLSAVELGRSSGEGNDSAQFRALLQADVARRMGGVEMKTLLPVRLIRRHISAAAAILLLTAGLMVVSGWRLQTLLLRALLPGANLDRVSHTRVIVHEPAGGDRMVPYGETVRVVVELAGDPADRARIETTGIGPDAESSQVIEMQPLGGNRFAASVQVARTSMRYRIKAGDALTKKYLLDARGRPLVTEFTKTFHFPKYSGLPEQSVTENSGSLSALEGTEVDLKLKTTELVKLAELLVEQGNTSVTQPLVIGADGSLSGKITMTASGSYRVRLVSAETGFENKFSPENEIQSVPDMLPSVELHEPAPRLTLPVHESVKITGAAADDVGILKVSRLERVNDGDWKETVLLERPGSRTPIADRWDLFQSGAKPGDVLTMKLAVTDLKGSRAESRSVQVAITDSGFNMRHVHALAALRTLGGSIRDLADHAEQLHGKVRAAQDGGDDAANVIRKAMSDIEAKFTATWVVLGDAMRQADDGHADAELALLGRALARLGFDVAKKIRADSEATKPSSAPSSALESASEFLRRAKALADFADAITESQEPAVYLECALVVQRELRRLLEAATAAGGDSAKWATLRGGLLAITAQASELEGIIGPNPAIARRPFRSPGYLLGMIRLSRENFEHTYSQGAAAGEQARLRLAEFSRAMDMAVQLFADWNRTSAAKHLAAHADDIPKISNSQPMELWMKMREQAGTNCSTVARLAGELDAIRKDPALTNDARRMMAALRWKNCAELFKANGDIEENRRQADNEFVSDLRNAVVALQGLHAASAEGNAEASQMKLAELESVFRVLESAHDLQEVDGALAQLESSERWEARDIGARTNAPRDWRWLEARLRTIPEEFAKAGEPFQRLAEAEKAELLFVFKSYRPDPKHPGEFLFEIEYTREKKIVTHRVGDWFPNSKIGLGRFVRNVVKNADGTEKDESVLVLVSAAPNPPLKLNERFVTVGSGTNGQTAKMFGEAREVLLKAQQLGAWREMEMELGERAVLEHTPVSMHRQTAQMAAQVKLALDLFRKPVEEARKRLSKLSPTASQLAAAIASEQNALERKTEERAKNHAADTSDEADADGKRLLVQQRQINEKLETLKDLLRADANKQEILHAGQRERMRDVDDALAMLKEPPLRAEQALEDSTAAPREEKKGELMRAVEQQRKTADALAQIAKHFENLEQGKPGEDSRRVLREMEKELGIKDQLDSQQAHTQMLAEMTRKDPAALLRELEAKLPDNPSMQDELSGISKNSLVNANERLADASEREAAVAKSIEERLNHELAVRKPDNETNNTARAFAQPDAGAPSFAHTAREQSVISANAGEAADATDRSGRHEKRLGNHWAGEQLQKLAAAMRDTANKQVSEAQQALEKVAAAQQVQPPVDAASKQLTQHLRDLRSALSGQMHQVRDEPSAMQKGQQASTPENLQKWPHEQQTRATAAEQQAMARALDTLDQQLNPSATQKKQQANDGSRQGQQGQMQNGQQGQQQENQQGQQRQEGNMKGQQAATQNAMQQVAQAAQSSMRQDRSESSSTKPGSLLAANQGDKSLGGAKADGTAMSAKNLPNANSLKRGEWGKLPKKFAEQLTKGTQEAVPSEYREAVETYYRVIAEKAGRKQ